MKELKDVFMKESSVGLINLFQDMGFGLKKILKFGLKENEALQHYSHVGHSLAREVGCLCYVHAVYLRALANSSNLVFPV